MKVYNTPRDKLNYMNTLNLKIELNKQSKNIDYQPFVPTIEQKSFFLDSNITDEELANMSADQFLRKKNEIDEAFEKNIRTIANPSMVNDIINKAPFKDSTFNKLFINKNWTLFIEKLKKKFVSVDNNTFNEFATEFIKKNSGKLSEEDITNKNLGLKKKETRAQREINSYNIEDLRVRNEAYDKNNLLKSVVYSNNKINEDYDRWENITKWNGDNGDNLISLINSADEMNHIIVNDINNNQSIIDRSNQYMVDNEQKRDTIQNFSYDDAINEVKREIQNMIVKFNDINDYMRTHNSQQYKEDRNKAENLLKLIKGSRLKYDDEIINNIKTIDERLETLDKNYGVRNTRNITRIMDKLSKKYITSKLTKKLILESIIKNFNDRLNDKKIMRVYNILKINNKGDIVINEETINDRLNELQRAMNKLEIRQGESFDISMSSLEEAKILAEQAYQAIPQINQNFKNINNVYQKMKNKIATTEQINNIKENLKEIQKNIEQYKNEQNQNFNVYNQESKLQMNDIINEIKEQIKIIINDINKLKELSNTDKNNEYEQFKKEVLSNIQTFEQNFNVQIKDKLNNLSNQDKITYDDSSIKKLIDDIKNNLENQIIQSVNTLQQENKNIRLTNEERFNKVEENIKLNRNEINELKNDLIKNPSSLSDLKKIDKNLEKLIDERYEEMDLKSRIEIKQQLQIYLENYIDNFKDDIKRELRGVKGDIMSLVQKIDELKEQFNKESAQGAAKHLYDHYVGYFNAIISEVEEKYNIYFTKQLKEKLLNVNKIYDYSKDVTILLDELKDKLENTKVDINQLNINVNDAKNQLNINVNDAKNQLKELINNINELKEQLGNNPNKKEVQIFINDVNQKIEQFEQNNGQILSEKFKKKSLNPSRKNSLSDDDLNETMMTNKGDNQEEEKKYKTIEIEWSNFIYDDLSKEDKILYNDAMIRGNFFGKNDSLLKLMYTTGGRNTKKKAEEHLLMWINNKETSKTIPIDDGPKERLKQILYKEEHELGKKAEKMNKIINTEKEGKGIKKNKIKIRGGNIKPLNKQQKKNIILGEIKAGNNNKELKILFNKIK